MKFSRDNWEHVKIRGVVEVINGTTPKGFESFGVSGEYPFFKVSDMNLPGNEIYMENHTIGLNTEEVDKYKIKLCPKDTIIFPKRGASIYTNKKRILVNSAGFDLNTMGFVPKECLNPYYLFVWFQTIDLGDISDGSYIPQINNKNIDILEIPLPPFEEQQCIAELFQSIDVVIKEVEKQETKLKLLQKALITSLTSKEPTFGNLLNYNNYKVLTYGNIVDCIEQHDKEKINVSRFIGLEHIEPENLNITTWADIEKGTTFTKRFSKGDI